MDREPMIRAHYCLMNAVGGPGGGAPPLPPRVS
jgi:hypothetical protein